MSKTIAIIVEGQKYEKGVFQSLYQNVLRKIDNAVPKFIALPAGENIYMIWREIAKDSDLDIIEVIRERSTDAKKELTGYVRSDFSEIYLFFDFDAHQDNLPKDCDAATVIASMLNTFDNETENGKLFISYPMAEAVRDFREGSCEAFSGRCCISFDIGDYKNKSGKDNKLASVKRYKEKEWKNVILCYQNRICRLFNEHLSLGSCKGLSALDIYKEQKRHIDSCSEIVILSAFAEYFIDYFRSDIIEEFLGGENIDCSRKCYDS